MRVVSHFALALTALVGATAAHGQDRLCGQDYRVQSGDTLSSLAIRAYGSPARFLEFYEIARNAETLGSNPDLLRPGQVIVMPPCAGATAGPVDVGRSEGRLADESGGFIPRIEVVTAGDYAPFTDVEAPGRGMLTQVVTAALNASGLPNEHEIDFIDDWGAHLSILLPKGKYNLGFPWFKPDCSDPSQLPEGDRIRCDYEWSQPLYQITIGFYRAAGEAEPVSGFADLEGKRLCRPAGYLTFDLAQEGLTAETVTLVQPDTPDGCFTALERGEVDYVTLNRFTAEKAIARAGLGEYVTPIPLVTRPALHVVAHRDDRFALDYIAAVDRGLREIQESGLFDQIVNVHTQRHRREVQALASAER